MITHERDETTKHACVYIQKLPVSPMYYVLLLADILTIQFVFEPFLILRSV